MSEKWIAVILTLIVAMVFLTGYTYLDGYFDYFDVSIGELDFDIQHILVHSAPVFMKLLTDSAAYIILFAILFSALFFAYYLRRDKNISLKYAPIYFGISLFVFTFMGLISANSIGLKRAASDLKTLNRMAVSGIDQNDSITRILDSQPQARLHHLVTTQSTVFGVIRYRDGDDRWVIRVPKSQNVTIRVYQES